VEDQQADQLTTAPTADTMKISELMAGNQPGFLLPPRRDGTLSQELEQEIASQLGLGESFVHGREAMLEAQKLAYEAMGDNVPFSFVPGKNQVKSAPDVVSCQDAESRLVQGLSQINDDQGSTVGLVSGESEKSSAYADSGRAIRPYTAEAEVGDIIAEEARLIERAKAEGFFWGKEKAERIIAAFGPKGGGTEHDVYVLDDSKNAVVIRSTIHDSYGFRRRSA